MPSPLKSYFKIPGRLNFLAYDYQQGRGGRRVGGRAKEAQWDIYQTHLLPLARPSWFKISCGFSLPEHVYIDLSIGSIWMPGVSYFLVLLPENAFFFSSAQVTTVASHFVRTIHSGQC